MTSAGAANPIHWQVQARRWKHVGPPLKPGAEDLAFFTRHIPAKGAHGGGTRVLLLGVTPELYHLPWPNDRAFLALDHCPNMIESVWQGPREEVMCGDWLSMDLPDSSRDIALCDGGLSLLKFPTSHDALARNLRRVLAPGGVFLARLFSQQLPREDPDQVMDDLLAGKIPSLDVLKLRLGPSLMDNAVDGILMNSIWERFAARFPDTNELAARLEWDAEVFGAIESYRGSSNRFHFVSDEQVIAVFREHGFEPIETHRGSYARGEFCPGLALRLARK